MNEFLKADIFSEFPEWRNITYLGTVTPKILRFEVGENDFSRPFFLSSVVSREEKIAWQSFQDVLDHAARLAQPAMQGIFGLDILSTDIRTGLRHFNPRDFSQLLINHGRELSENPKTLIRYGQLFACLQKRASADWGKFEIITHAEIVDSGKTRFATYFKKMRKASGGAANAFYLIQDMSRDPVWAPETVRAENFYLHHPSLKTVWRGSDPK